MSCDDISCGWCHCGYAPSLLWHMTHWDLRPQWVSWQVHSTHGVDGESLCSPIFPLFLPFFLVAFHCRLSKLDLIWLQSLISCHFIHVYRKHKWSVTFCMWFAQNPFCYIWKSTITLARCGWYEGASTWMELERHGPCPDGAAACWHTNIPRHSWGKSPSWTH